MSNAYDVGKGGVPDYASGDSSGGDLLGGSPLGTGVLGLGIGAAGLGYMLAKGPGSLPPQFGQLEGQVPGLEAEAQFLEGQGGGLIGQGKEALGMAQRGELTPQQQAQLKVYSTGLENKARQEYAAMGRNPDADTSFIQTQQNIDVNINAMAQQQIQSTIALGLGQISSGTSLTQAGLGFQTQADNILIEAGKAQIALDKNYSDSLTAAFGAIGKLFGAGVKAVL